jgi:hypothetical protein
MSEQRIQSFEEFWPFYVREHSKKTTRQLHFLGTTAAMACVAAAALLGKRKLLLLAPLVGYGPAWIGHFFVEHNRPATFKYPLWSLKADLVMWSKTLAGTMDAEVDRATAQADGAATNGQAKGEGRDDSGSRDRQTLN